MKKFINKSKDILSKIDNEYRKTDINYVLLKEMITDCINNLLNFIVLNKNLDANPEKINIYKKVNVCCKNSNIGFYKKSICDLIDENLNDLLDPFILKDYLKKLHEIYNFVEKLEF